MALFTERAKQKGWKMKDIAERWGVTARQMSNVAKNPSTKDLDALAGLPDKRQHPG